MKQKTVEHYPDYWNKYVSDDKYEAKVISELRGLEKLTLPLNTFLNKNKIPKILTSARLIIFNHSCEEIKKPTDKKI